MPAAELEKLITNLEAEMFAAADQLKFEYAAKLRDEISELVARAGAAAGDGRMTRREPPPQPRAPVATSGETAMSQRRARCPGAVREGGGARRSRGRGH